MRVIQTLSYLILANIGDYRDRIQQSLVDTQAQIHGIMDEELRLTESSGDDSPPVDLADSSTNQQDLWNRVLSARCPLGSQSSGSNAGDTSSSEPSFESQSDSDADAQPAEEDEIPYNPATYGLTPEMLLRERSSVQQVINGVFFAFYFLNCPLNTLALVKLPRI